MKRTSICTILVLCLTSQIAHADGLAPAVSDQVVILPKPAKSLAAGIIVPLLFVALLVAADSANSTTSDGEQPKF